MDSRTVSGFFSEPLVTIWLKQLTRSLLILATYFFAEVASVSRITGISGSNSSRSQVWQRHLHSGGDGGVDARSCVVGQGVRDVDEARVCGLVAASTVSSTGVNETATDLLKVMQSRRLLGVLTNFMRRNNPSDCLSSWISPSDCSGHIYKLMQRSSPAVYSDCIANFLRTLWYFYCKIKH